jgi:exodeoxyribonuclease III
LKLLCWNVAGRTTLLSEQVAAVVRQEPDLVCLQEIRPSTRDVWAGELAEIGLDHALDSGEFRNERRLFNLTVSRWPLTELPAIPAPHPERVLSAVVETPAGLLDLHNAHVPPAQSRGFTKVETCEAICERLARPADRHRVLCGDLNLPQEETVHGEVITFAENHPEFLERWDAAERSLLPGLAEWDLADQFRALNGWDRRDVSWVFHTRSQRKSGHRLDHVLASASLATAFCDYHHGWRELGLSDHSAIEAHFAPDAIDGHGSTPR